MSSLLRIADIARIWNLQCICAGDRADSTVTNLLKLVCELVGGSVLVSHFIL